MPTNVKADDGSGQCCGAAHHASTGKGDDGKGNTLVVDVRDAPEVEKTGKVAGAVQVSRGMLEFRADAETPSMTSISPRTRQSFFIARPAGDRRSVARCSRTWAMGMFLISAPSRTGSKTVGRWISRSSLACERG